MLLLSHFEFTFALILYIIAISFFSSIVTPITSIVTPIIVKIINENLIGKFISKIVHHK